MIVMYQKQINDMIAVRLFLSKDTELTWRLAPSAYGWAQSRKIPVAVIDKTKLVLVLPMDYHQYLDWSQATLASPTIQEMFTNSLDIVCETGWFTQWKHVHKFTVEERRWILENAPDQYGWLAKAKS
jgi:ligand-binding SRPBCC domain-containing protein